MIISRPQTADSAPSSRRESFSVPPNHQNIDQFSMKPRSIDGLHVAGVAGSIAGSSIQHSVLGNHSVHSSYHAATNRDTASVAEMLGDYEASVLSTPPVRFVEHGEVQGFTHSMNHSNTFNPYNNHNNHNYTLSSELPNNNNRPNIPSLSAVNHGPKKRLNRPSSAPPMKILSQSHLLQQRILSKQTTNLQRLSKSKDGLDRLNNPHKTISADYVLFLECLKNDIFPYYDNQLLDGSQTDHDLVEEDDEHGHISFVEHHTQLTDDQLQPVPSSSTGIALSRQSTNTGLLASQSTYQMDQSHRSQGNRVRHRGPNIHYNSFLASEQLQVRNSHIITLDLGNQGIGVDKGMCLSQALTYCSQLEICNLSNNRLSDKAIHAILQTLCMLDDKPSLDPAVDKKYSMLRYLDLSNNEAGKQSAALLAEFLKHCSDDSTASDDIDLTLGRALDNSLTLDGDSHWLQTSSIISHTATNKMMRICQLEYLNLSYCNLGDEWSCWIAKGMKHADCCVRELQMVSNRIGAEEVSIKFIY